MNGPNEMMFDYKLQTFDYRLVNKSVNKIVYILTAGTPIKLVPVEVDELIPIITTSEYKFPVDRVAKMEMSGDIFIYFPEDYPLPQYDGFRIRGFWVTRNHLEISNDEEELPLY